MIQVICCSSLLSVPGRTGAFSRDFITILTPECRAFSGALKIEKLKKWHSKEYQQYMVSKNEEKYHKFMRKLLFLQPKQIAVWLQ